MQSWWEMKIFGLSISEVLGIISLFGTVILVFRWFFKNALLAIEIKLVNPLKEDFIQPLKNSLDNLASKLDGMEQKAHVEHEDFKKQLSEHDGRLDKHDLKLTEHEQQIKSLFKSRKGGES